MSSLRLALMCFVSRWGNWYLENRRIIGIIQDMAGVLRPRSATILIDAIRQRHPELPIHVHSHDTGQYRGCIGRGQIGCPLTACPFWNHVAVDFKWGHRSKIPCRLNFSIKNGVFWRKFFLNSVLNAFYTIETLFYIIISFETCSFRELNLVKFQKIARKYARCPMISHFSWRVPDDHLGLPCPPPPPIHPLGQYLIEVLVTVAGYCRRGCCGDNAGVLECGRRRGGRGCRLHVGHDIAAIDGRRCCLSSGHWEGYEYRTQGMWSG